jgi:acyl-CoA reductase-like NAD-dependent aldehyde dehydrogenase
MQDETDNPGYGDKSSQNVLAGLHATTSKVFIENVTALKHSLLQTYPGSEDQSATVTEQLHARHVEAAANLQKAKQRVRALDHIEKASFPDQTGNEMRDYRGRISKLLSETEKQLKATEAAYIETFRDAESENWASVLTD